MIIKPVVPWLKVRVAYDRVLLDVIYRVNCGENVDKPVHMGCVQEKGLNEREADSSTKKTSGARLD